MNKRPSTESAYYGGSIFSHLFILVKAFLIIAYYNSLYRGTPNLTLGYNIRHE